MPHWENRKLLPFNHSSDVYHISLSAFVARKLRAGSHDPQEQLCWFPCGGGTRGPGGRGAAGVQGGRAGWGPGTPVPLQLPLAEHRAPSHAVLALSVKWGKSSARVCLTGGV